MNDTKPNFYDILKEKRKTKQISLKEMSEYTKINIGYLESLESGKFDTLPNVYTRLFLRSYCEYIGLDSKEILDEYQIYTVGNYKKDDFSSLNDDLQKSDSQEINNSQKKTVALTKKPTDSKEMLVLSGVIIIIIIVFIIILNLNG
tara:strand:- start:1213 stop:1650 length:438 start_codon:yes stop_codon:yes gene_type:complete